MRKIFPNKNPPRNPQIVSFYVKNEETEINKNKIMLKEYIIHKKITKNRNEYTRLVY
jgi:hypothetical protein